MLVVIPIMNKFTKKFMDNAIRMFLLESFDNLLLLDNKSALKLSANIYIMIINTIATAL